MGLLCTVNLLPRAVKPAAALDGRLHRLGATGAADADEQLVQERRERIVASNGLYRCLQLAAMDGCNIRFSVNIKYQTFPYENAIASKLIRLWEA